MPERLENIEISIIICTYNRDKYIGLSIGSILKEIQHHPQYELIVVNNNCTDGTHQKCLNLLDEHGENAFQYFIETQQGLSYARNRGIEESKGEILVFIDDDAICHAGFVQHISHFYRSHPKVGATGGRIYAEFETQQPTWLPKYLFPLMSVIDLGNEAKPFGNTKYPIGANMAVRSKVIDEVGMFNVLLGRNGSNLLGGEEKEIFSRIRKLGYEIWYVPNAIVNHVIPESRLQLSFIQRMGKGIGLSEYIRAKEIGNREWFKSLLVEGMKWGATFFIALAYCLTLQFGKAGVLIRFRKWVTSGLLNWDHSEK